MPDSPHNSLKYLQLRDHLLTLINDGKYGVGAPLPPIRQIMSDNGVAQGTAVKAIEALEANGVVERRPGVGVFVRERSESRTRLRLNSISRFLWNLAAPGHEELSECRLANAADTTPSDVDVLSVTPNLTTDLVRRGQIIPLDAFLEKDPVFAASLDSRCPVYTRDAQTFAIPVYFAPLCLHLNDGLFEAVGVEPPGAAWSFEDLERTSVALSESGAGQALSWSGFLPYLLPFLCNGAPEPFAPRDGRPRLSGDATLARFEHLRRLSRVAGAPVQVEETPPWERFARGETPMLIWGTDRKPDSSAPRTSVLPLPGCGASVILSEGLAISATCRDPDAAWNLIKEFVAELAPRALIDRRMMFPATTRGILDFIARHGDGYAELYARLERPILSHLTVGFERLVILDRALGPWWREEVDLKQRLTHAERVMDAVISVDGSAGELMALA